MTEDRWLPVAGWEEQYEISERGQVHGMDRILSNSHLWKGRDINWLVSNNRGYLRVMVRLSKDGKRTSVGVGKLVLLTFVSAAPEGMECCHEDSDPFNNHVSNLRWDTHSANMFDTVARGTHNMVRIATSPTCVRGHQLPPPIPGYRRICLECKAPDRQLILAASA